MEIPRYRVVRGNRPGCKPFGAALAAHEAAHLNTQTPRWHTPILNPGNGLPGAPIPAAVIRGCGCLINGSAWWAFIRLDIIMHRTLLLVAALFAAGCHQPADEPVVRRRK
jgi:hypothetical protein